MKLKSVFYFSKIFIILTIGIIHAQAAIPSFAFAPKTDPSTFKNNIEPADTKPRYQDRSSNLSDDTKKYLRSKNLTDSEIQYLSDMGITDSILAQAKQLAASTWFSSTENQSLAILDNFSASPQTDLYQKAFSIPLETAEKIPGAIITAQYETGGRTLHYTSLNGGRPNLYQTSQNVTTVTPKSPDLLPTLKNSGAEIHAWLLK